MQLDAGRVLDGRRSEIEAGDPGDHPVGDSAVLRILQASLAGGMPNMRTHRDGERRDFATASPLRATGDLIMHKYLVYAAYGWLTLSGVLHFVIDVVSQHLRGKHPPGIETTLYYGLHSAFALGQVVFGSLGLFLAWRAMHLIGEAPAMILSIAAGLGWLAITFLFMEYWEPKFMVGIFCGLAVAAFFTR